MKKLPPRPSERTARLATAAVALGLLAPVASVAASLAPAVAANSPTVEGEACAPGTGVTVVVDFVKSSNDAADLSQDRVKIGCAPGEQANGYEALVNAGFATSDASGPGTVCQIDTLPAAGYPTCWFDGYWQYWRSAGRGASSYSMSQVGSMGTGTVPVDSVEGWSYATSAEAWSSPAPRVLPNELDAYVAPPLGVSTSISAPAISPIASAEVLPLSAPAGTKVEAAVLTDGQNEQDAVWTTTTRIPLSSYEGQTITLLLRAKGTDEVAFRSTYTVRPAYAPGSGLGTEANPDISVPYQSEEIAAWASGAKDYRPGPNVVATWQKPENALGKPNGLNTRVVVLGDDGEVTLTFDRPIRDGEGADLAVFENGFRSNPSKQLDSLELARVAVSSNGEDFAVFDSASRRATTVGGYEAVRADELGGLAGHDLNGYGTPFDLALLANHELVRSGKLNLQAVTEVKILDVTGDGRTPDSFGRPVYDPFPTMGSGGFDLTGVAVLNQGYLAPSAPQDATVSQQGRADIDVTWTAPEADGRAPVTEYAVTLTEADGRVITATTTGTSHRFTDVPVGSWTASVTAANVAGNSPAAHAAAPVDVVAQAPDAPTAPRVAVKDRTTLVVTWDAPTHDNGAPVTGYTVTLTSTTGETLTAPASSTTHTFTGVPVGTWRARVSAANVAGSSADSEESTHAVVAAPTAKTDPSAGTPKAEPTPGKVTKKASTVKVTVTRKATRSKAGRATVKVTAKKVTATGKVKVTLKVPGVRKAKVLRPTLKNGKVTVKLSKAKRKGTYRVTVRYAGNAKLKAAPTKMRTFTVR